ncbi:MAG TPA: restriction endonuclease, partial [Methanobacterium sp.]
MEKTRLVNFVAKVMEESGFKVYKNFQTSRHIIDIYGVLPSILGDVGVVVGVKNYDERWEVGLDVLKEMEMVAKTLKASKIVVVSSSYFTDNAVNYAGRRNIKLIDKEGLVNLAKKFSNRNYDDEGEDEEVEVSSEEEYQPVAKPNSFSFLSGSRKSLNKGGKAKPVSRPLGPTLRKILSNTIVLIIIVLAIS